MANPIISSVTRPAHDAILSAYRTIPCSCTANNTGTPAIQAYCDVYFDGVYYNTVMNINPIYDGGGNATFNFDIQQSAQTYLHTNIPVNGTGVVTACPNQRTSCQVRFRLGWLDTDGILQQTTPIPQQATANTPAVSGGGTPDPFDPDDAFYILNASLQQRSLPYLSSERYLVKGLQYYTNKLLEYGSMASGVDSYFYILTHQFSEKMALNDFGVLRFYFSKTIHQPDSVDLTYCVTLYDGNKHVTGQYFFDTYTFNQDMVYNIRTGISDINNISPIIAWENYAYYTVSLWPNDGFTLPYICSPMYQITGQGATRTKVFFVNYLGGIDSMTFLMREESHKAVSKEREQFLQEDIEFAATRRMALTSNESNDAYGAFTEQEMQVFKELLDAPLAWIMWRTDELYFGLPAISYNQIYGQNYLYEHDGEDNQTKFLAIKIEDTEQNTYKVDNRYIYRPKITYKLAQRNILLRQ